jgi:hypothetical protein
MSNSIAHAYNIIVENAKAISDLHDYAADSWINTSLRNIPSEKSLKIADSIDRLAEPSKTPYNLLRSIHSDHPMSNHISRLKAGDIYQDKGFLSTSKSKKGLDSVISSGEESGLSPEHILHITIPKGHHIIDVNRHLGNHYHKSQDEILLQRNTKLLKTGEYIDGDVVHHQFKIAD